MIGVASDEFLQGGNRLLTTPHSLDRQRLRQEDSYRDCADQDASLARSFSELPLVVRLGPE